MYNKIRLQLTKKRVEDDVVDLIKQDLAYKQRKETVFDTCPEQIYNLHFKNGVYELNNQLFRERYKRRYSWLRSSRSSLPCPLY